MERIRILISTAYTALLTSTLLIHVVSLVSLVPLVSSECWLGIGSAVLLKTGLYGHDLGLLPIQSKTLKKAVRRLDYLILAGLCAAVCMVNHHTGELQSLVQCYPIILGVGSLFLANELVLDVLRQWKADIQADRNREQFAWQIALVDEDRNKAQRQSRRVLFRAGVVAATIAIVWIIRRPKQ